MFKKSDTLPAKKKAGSNKLILGFAALAATAVVGTTGISMAAAQNKPTKAECAAAGFKNYGQCVKEWAHQHGGGHGGGYGGNHNATVITNLTLNHSNGNIIRVIINFFN